MVAEAAPRAGVRGKRFARPGLAAVAVLGVCIAGAFVATVQQQPRPANDRQIAIPMLPGDDAARREATAQAERARQEAGARPTPATPPPPLPSSPPPSSPLPSSPLPGSSGGERAADIRIAELERQLAEARAGQLRPSAPQAASPEPEIRFTLLLAAALVAVLIAVAGLAWLVARRRRKPLVSTLRSAAAPAPPARAEGGQPLFISYAHLDRVRVDPVVVEIEALGRAIWIDRKGMTGEPGWAGQIVRAIRGSRAVVLMGSSNAYASDQVVRELYLAMSAKKAIIAIEIEAADLPDEFAYILAPYQRHQMNDQDIRLVLSRALVSV